MGPSDVYIGVRLLIPGEAWCAWVRYRLEYVQSVLDSEGHEATDVEDKVLAKAMAGITV